MNPVMHHPAIAQHAVQRQVTDVNGFAVPALLWADDAQWVIEMEIVSPPFVLDFASAYLDEQPDYPEDVMQRWVDEKAEQFGADRWSIVESVMAKFGGMGIYLADVKPGNISFED